MADLFTVEENTSPVGSVRPEEVLVQVGKLKVESILDIQKLNALAIAFKDTAESLVITNQEQNANASDVRGAIKAQMKKVVALEKEKTAPVKTLLDRMKAFFSPIKADLETADGIVGKKILDYKQKCDREAAEAQRKIDEERRAKEAEAEVTPFAVDEPDPEPPPPIVVPPPNISRGTSSSTHFRKVWRHRVIDLKKVEPKYFALNEMMVKDDIRVIVASGKDPTNAISGIEAYQVEIPITTE